MAKTTNFMRKKILKPRAPRKKRFTTIVVPRGIFSKEEKVELEKLLPAYKQCKRTPGKKWAGFWDPTWGVLFGKFPLPPLTAEQIAQGVDQGHRKGERVAIYKQVR